VSGGDSWPIVRFSGGSALAQVTLDFGFGDEDFANFRKFPKHPAADQAAHSFFTDTQFGCDAPYIERLTFWSGNCIHAGNHLSHTDSARLRVAGLLLLFEREEASVAHRCEPHWRVLMDWLESNGISARKKIHELRKIFGDAIVKQNGIFAGSAQLRHSTIQMTASHYTDPRQRAALPVGNVFSEVIEQDSKTNQPQINSYKAVPRVKPGTGGISHVS
jgi:hypothetical protein